jgi:uncharacterized membrane protein YkvA (DUF1232 family)
MTEKIAQRLMQFPFDRVEERLERYRLLFSENRFWRKLSRFGRKAGIQVVYAALLMFYAYRRKETPGWAKNIAFGVLGYLISPIDWLPDISPIIGYTDDFGVLMFGLVTIAAFVNVEVKNKARTKLSEWFGDFDDAELENVDKQL